MGMNELLITELVLKGKLTRFQPAEVAALLSGLVFQASTRVVPELSPDLKQVNPPPLIRIDRDDPTPTFQGIKEINEVFDELLAAERQLKIMDDSVKDLNFGLCEVVYEWAMAKPFAEILLLTDVQEGIIVRCIQQLNETLCDVREVARIIGETQLQSKMEEASTAVKRDIVFAASLYTQQDMANL